ncbi:hypothetical protein CHS0354_016495 [Potamilus streckersoni]|uniref:C-type lectin domain-containing protein n=1 Tax=Potamilus streckersoni TaxID=2493646 RepID=A0AAE0VWP4_9BIVA|nr:hypothetical protein CHS0354_016495 [Potamilus streckersoni]
MDVWMLRICLGSLYLFLLNHVSGNLFQTQSQVIWSDAEVACQQANGTLFKPDKGSFDIQLFENRTLDGDSWVAAIYTYVNHPETSFRMNEPDVRDRCIAFEIRQDCTGQYWHKACNETYSIICESYHALDRQWILGRDTTWVAASDLCQSRSMKLATFITNTRQLFDQGPCQPGIYWTGRVIEVDFQSNAQPRYSQGACGFLQNHVLSFGDCSRKIRSLCITDSNLLQHDYRTSSPLTGELSSSSTTSYWITQITSTSRDKTMSTRNGPHTNHSLFHGISIKHVSSSLSTDMQMKRDMGLIYSHGEDFNLSDAGVIIGSVLGCALFIFLIVLLVIILRKKRAQGNGMISEEKETMNSKTLRMTKTQKPTNSLEDHGMVLVQQNPTHSVEDHGMVLIQQNPTHSVEDHGMVLVQRNPTHSVEDHGMVLVQQNPTHSVEDHGMVLVQRNPTNSKEDHGMVLVQQNPTHSVGDHGMVLVQPRSTNPGNVSATSHLEGFNGDRLEEISKTKDSINSPMDFKDDDNNYRRIKRRSMTPNTYESIHLDDDSYDHLEYENKPGSGNVTIHVYDKANYHLRHKHASECSIICDTTDEPNKPVEKHDGVYNKANHNIIVDYNTTHVIASDKDTSSYHV